MRAINHALTGSLIGLSISQPAVAMTLAFGSHFVLDAIPHHGFAESDELHLKSAKFEAILIIDALLCLVLVLLLGINKPANYLLAIICAFLAAVPDFIYVNRFIKAKNNQKWRPNRLVKFTVDIQWFQRPIGAVVEVLWFVGASILLSTFLH